MTMGERIAQKRKELGLSQEALGEQLGVSRQSIYKWESGAAVPEVDKLVALSRLFGVPVGWLLGVEGPAPASDGAAPEELTEAQLRMVEEIASRYAAALPKPLSRRRRLGVKLAAAGAAVCLAAGLGSLAARLERMDRQYQDLQNDVARLESSVNGQIGSMAGRVEEILKAQNSLLADYGAELFSADLEENRGVFSVRAVPKTYTQGMTVQFSIDNGTGGVQTVRGQSAPGGGFTAALACRLTDRITISAVLTDDAGTRSTQLLEEFRGLYSASLPAVEIYGGENLPGLKADGSGLVTLPEVTVTVRPRASDGTEHPALGQSELASVRVGLFRDQALLAWLEDLGDGTFRLPAGRQAALTGETDTLQFAAVVTDAYGRQAVYADIPCILSAGELTWPAVSDLSGHDPANWQY